MISNMKYVVLTFVFLSFSSITWSKSIEDEKRDKETKEFCMTTKALAEKGKAHEGEVLILGISCGLTDKEMFRYELIVAKNGSAMHQNSVGVAYMEGKLVKKDFREAVKWYRKSADQGFTDAQKNLAVAYIVGNGVIQDHAEAFKLMHKAAIQGAPNGQRGLAQMYLEGIGVQKNYKKAVLWMSKAAEQGDKNSQASLAVQYVKGEGVPQDYVKAHMWINIAAAGGDEKYVVGRDKITELLTPSQLADAQKLAREWMEQHP